MKAGRRERDKENMRERILAAASEIITADGLDRLTVRKIAARIEYSPAIIYHYFRDKEDIISQAAGRTYGKIVTAASAVQLQGASPEVRLTTLVRNYITAALGMPPALLAAKRGTNALDAGSGSEPGVGISENNPAIRELCQCIKDLNQEKSRLADEETVQLTAQVILAAVLGLVTKLDQEKDMDSAYRQRLIDFMAGEAALRLAKGKKPGKKAK